MIKGIADLDYNEAKRLLSEIIERSKAEEETLQGETEEKKIEVLLHEYGRRLEESKHGRADREKAIEACNQRMQEIENELFALADRKSYFEVQLDMLGVKRG